MTRKFQVTIPKKIADKAGIKPGFATIVEEWKDYLEENYTIS